MSKQNWEYFFSDKDKEFAKFLDKLYRNYHNDLDRLGFYGILKLSQVIVENKKEIIEKLNNIEA